MGGPPEVRRCSRKLPTLLDVIGIEADSRQESQGVVKTSVERGHQPAPFIGLAPSDRGQRRPEGHDRTQCANGEW